MQGKKCWRHYKKLSCQGKWNWLIHTIVPSEMVVHQSWVECIKLGLAGERNRIARILVCSETSWMHSGCHILIRIQLVLLLCRKFSLIILCILLFARVHFRITCIYEKDLQKKKVNTGETRIFRQHKFIAFRYLNVYYKKAKPKLKSL